MEASSVFIYSYASLLICTFVGGLIGAIIEDQAKKWERF
jgi:hypothetical protein